MSSGHCADLQCEQHKVETQPFASDKIAIDPISFTLPRFLFYLLPCLPPNNLAGGSGKNTAYAGVTSGLNGCFNFAFPRAILIHRTPFVYQ